MSGSLPHPQFIAQQTRIAILRFQPPPDLDEMDLARFEAARVSMEQKAKSFQFLGCQIESIPPLPFDLPAPEFRAIIGRLNANPQIRGIIVQYPIDRLLAPLVREIAPEKDLDALSANSPFQAPATSAGIVRIVEPFATDALMRSQVQRQQQHWAAAIFPIATALFDRTFQRQPDTFQTDKAGAIVLPGRNYTLRLDPTCDLFAIEGTRGRGQLAAFRRSQGTLIMAEGLTGVDAVNWQQIRQRSLQQRQRDQDWER